MKHLHQRIRDDIEARIMSGDWPPGHRIPFEHELMAEYGCSRMTVNKVLSTLARWVTSSCLSGRSGIKASIVAIQPTRSFA